MTTTFDAQVTAALFDATGAIFALGDGSVRFYSDNIDLNLWRALATARGGEAFSPP